MEFESILYASTSQEIQRSEPGFFQDIRLDYLLGIIERTTREYAIRKHYYTLPASAGLVRYRQEVFRDLARPTLNQCIKNLCVCLQKSRRARDLAHESGEGFQAAGFHLEAAALYWDGLLAFEREVAGCVTESEGMRAMRQYLAGHVGQLRKDGFEGALQTARGFLEQIRFRLVVDRENIVIEEGGDRARRERPGEEDSVWDRNYLREMADLLGLGPEEAQDYMEGMFPNVLEPSYLELTMMQMLGKHKPVVMKEIMGFWQAYPNFYSERILRFEDEIQFYISFLEFKNNTEKLGYMLREPRLSTSGRFSGQGVYDLALVWNHAGRDYEVISNDFSFVEEASFFVVTGPNQGGKTTFARSVAQSVYLGMMGLHVNADSLDFPWFDGISTHFEAEEDLQSNAGKLKDEINRLVPMLHQNKRNHFIVLNELFTTATTHDARIMGRKVMDYFLMQDCYGIYVTHIQELAEETGSILSLVAQVAPGDEDRRTYRMKRMAAQGHGYSDSLVKQFGLCYEDLIRRLA